MADESKNLAEAQDSECAGPSEAESCVGLNPDEVLKTRVDKDAVIDFIDNMVHAMGKVAVGNLPQQYGQKPEKSRAANDHRQKKQQSKVAAQIMQKLARLEKYPDLAKEVQEDPFIHEWLSKPGCKQKDYYDELECAQELTGFFGAYRRFDLAIKAAEKARSMTLLHAKDDEETLGELNWVLADLHAGCDKMEKALQYLRWCIDIVEPGANEESSTYKELLKQLEETNQKSRLLLTV